MSPAPPRYVGRGGNTCGEEVVYTIQEIRTLLQSQPEDAKQLLTTGQMGWALTREENEVINAKDEREGKPVARQLAQMISKFIRVMMMSFICSCRNKKEEPSSIYTFRKVRTIRGCLEGLTLMI
jgi:hypothetical protein